MISFVNAKINIGLNVERKREDGYHDISTVFFPVGLECGLPHQPYPFDDVLEINCDKGEISGCRFQFMGRRIDCAPRDNLVVKATSLFLGKYNSVYNDLAKYGVFEITLDKHLPDGAGLGGGSADAAFTLDLLNQITEEKFSKDELMEMALRLGADCPFFLENRPCFAAGVGEELHPIDLKLDGNLLLIIKPDFSVSTKEAFQGIIPRKPDFDLRFLPYLPLDQWKDKVFNDFETTVFQIYPELSNIKENLYSAGAVYASMTGSGSAIYGIFDDHEAAYKELERIKSTYQGVWLFGL